MNIYPTDDQPAIKDLKGGAIFYYDSDFWIRTHGSKTFAVSLADGEQMHLTSDAEVFDSRNYTLYPNAAVFLHGKASE